jgi:hypothetical protein
MTRHDQELLEKQLWAVTSPPQNGTMIGLMLVAVFLVGRPLSGVKRTCRLHCECLLLTQSGH